MKKNSFLRTTAGMERSAMTVGKPSTSSLRCAPFRLLFLALFCFVASIILAQQPTPSPALQPLQPLPMVEAPSEEEDDPPPTNPSSSTNISPKTIELPKPDESKDTAIDAGKVKIKEDPPQAVEPKKEEVVKPEAAPPTPAPAPAPPTTTDIPQKTEEPKLTDAETESLLRQRIILSKVKSPDELLQYLRETLQARNYRAASMAMAFEKTNYVTGALRQECLAKWSDIVDRIESIYPRNFPTYSVKTDRLFLTADSEITLEFVKDVNDCWQLGPQTILRTDEIYNDVRNDPPIHGDWISKNVPHWMHQVRFGLSYFRWTMLFLTMLLGIVVYWIVQETLYWAMRAYMHVRYREVTKMSLTVWKHVGLIAMAVVWFYAFKYIVADPKVFSIAYFLFSVFVAVMLIIISMKVVDLLAQALRVRILAKNQYSSENVENLIVPFFSRTMKVLVVCAAIGWLGKQFGWPLAAVISGMGIGGITVAFAAKETVANLFGSVTVMVDRPFEIGDWIETNGVAGTVISVGMRSTRIQTFDFSTITIPNNNLTTAVITNFGRRRNRRFKIFLGLQYDTPLDRIDAFCEGLRELVMKNAFTQKEGFFIGLNQLSASSIDILFNVVLVCPSGDTEFRERAKLLRNIMKLAETMDIRFAFPSQTLHLDRDIPKPYAPLPGSNSVERGRNFANQILFPNQPAQPPSDETVKKP